MGFTWLNYNPYKWSDMGPYLPPTTPLWMAKNLKNGKQVAL